MSTRHEAREAALCMLYQADLARESPEATIASFLGSDFLERPLEAEAQRFAEHIVRGVLAQRDELDDLIRQGSENWRIERMAAVDRNVLRLALFELLDERDTDAAVILDEAVELAKAFGGDESSAFVNGVVDGIRRRLAAGTLQR